MVGDGGLAFAKASAEADEAAEAAAADITDEEDAAACIDEDEALAFAARDEEEAAAAAEEEEAVAAARLTSFPPRTTSPELVIVGLAEIMLLELDAEACPVTLFAKLDEELGCAHVSFPAPSSSSLFCTLSGQRVVPLPSRPFHATRNTPPGRT